MGRRAGELRPKPSPTGTSAKSLQGRIHGVFRTELSGPAPHTPIPHAYDAFSGQLEPLLRKGPTRIRAPEDESRRKDSMGLDLVSSGRDVPHDVNVVIEIPMNAEPVK